VKKIVHEPVVVEHHHHHTHEVVHPKLERQHETAEIRQVIQPVVEKVREVKTEDRGETTKVVHKKEDDSHAHEKIRDHKAEIRAQGGSTVSTEKTKEVKDTRVKDVHAGHQVIEEVTPVVYRDVQHDKIVHKDETIIEKIKHAPDVVTETRETKVVPTHGVDKDVNIHMIFYPIDI